jgi:predicted extracellular nuclease
MLRPRRRATLAVALALPLLATPLLASPASAVPANASPVFVNELHYDNAGADVDEFIEVANPGARDLSGWSIALYNGANPAALPYRTTPLPGGTDAFQVVDHPSDGIQNGSPDAVALVDAGGALVQFLSYEGVFTAGAGPAAGSASTDIGSREAGSESPGQSLQLTGTGTTYGDFRWTGPTARTPGAANTGQSFGGTPPVEEPPVEEPPVEEPPAEPPVRRISAVQGAGPATPLSGSSVRVEAVVTSLFERNDALDGFFVQEQDADADDDPLTSEGLFVFCRGACPSPLATGDRVEVTGKATEFFGMTQLEVAAGGVQVLDHGQALPTAVELPLPAKRSTRDAATFEAAEGMVVTVPRTLAVSEFFALARFGTISLTAGERPYQFTHSSLPSESGYAAFRADLATRVILLDDDNNDQNDAISGPDADEPYPYPAPGLSVDSTVRGGDTITGLTGVLHWSFSGTAGTDAWRLRPIAGADYTFTRANPRTAEPDEVGGRLRVASFNVLNYFTTLDETSSDSGPCGPTGGADCRGADSLAELDRQRAKTVAAITAIDPHIAGLIEIQNDQGAATAHLVAALNAATAPERYAFVQTGSIGTDAIKQAFVYQPAAVRPVGKAALLTSAVHPDFVDTANRPALAQTFEEVATGERLTVAVNHFKSKGSACTGDPDVGDGQGNCNVTRTAAARALAAWLATGPTGTADTDVLVIGDLNSYRNEAPIQALEAAGYTDLIEGFGGEDAYGYLFDGQLGYLDHALANASLLRQVTGATEWHINADEVPLLDYNDAVHDAPGEAPFERESGARPLYAPDPYRSSDHDPVVVGLDLDSTGPALVSVDPSDGTELGDRSASLVATFDEPLAQGSTARLSGPFGAEPVAVQVEGSTLTVDPARRLPGRPGTYVLTFEVLDEHGNAATATSTFVVRPGNGPMPAG